MAETATETTTIAAPLDTVWAVVTDVERYPEWAKDVKAVEVLRRDDDGRPVEVEFRAAALGRSARYTLGYDYSQSPGAMSWSLVDGDIMRRVEGAYQFTVTADGGTEVRYDLLIELAAPMPGFVKRRAEVRILNTLRELKARVEA